MKIYVVTEESYDDEGRSEFEVIDAYTSENEASERVEQLQRIDKMQSSGAWRNFGFNYGYQEVKLH